MDERQRQVFEKAYAALDSVAAMEAERQAALQSETLFQKIQREGEEADAFLAEVQQRRIEQTGPQTFPAVGKVQPKAQPMTDADKRWVWDCIHAVVKVVAEETDKKECKLRREIIARRDQIWADIAALRADLTIMQALHKASNVSPEGSITSLRNCRVA